MSYGLDNYDNNKVKCSRFIILTVLQLDIKKRRMRFPIVFISALDQVGMDVKNQSADF